MRFWKLAGGTLALALALGGAILWLAPGAQQAHGTAGQRPFLAPLSPPNAKDGTGALESPPQRPRFTYVKTTEYSCGGESHAIKEFRHDLTGLEFALVPAGSLRKPGGPQDQEGQPVVEAAVASFLMAKTEVPQRVWVAVMGANPSRSKGADHPVDSVSWVQARSFCAKTGLALPTELEWEYACRAGTESAFFWGDKLDTEYGWLEDNAAERTRPVGTRRPNAFGLHDMIGNVYEWCDTWFHREGMSYEPAKDALRKGERPLRVLRGGSAASPTCCAFSGSRSGNWAGKATPYDGFRPIARLAAAELTGGE